MRWSQIAVGNYPYAMYSFNYFLESMKRLGVDRIEVWAAGPHFYLDDFDYFRMKEFAGKIRRAGVKAVCLTPEQCQYPVSISVEDPVMRRRSLNYFKKAIDAAELLECPKVLVTPGRSMLDYSRETGVAICIDSLNRLAEYAIRRNVTLVLEALTRTTTFIAHRPEELKVLLDGAGNPPNLLPMLDTDGAAREGLRPRDFFRLFGEMLAHIHFTDGYPGGHVVLGQGRLDMNGYLEEIDSAGYQGYIALELLDRQYYLEPEQAVKDSLEFFRRYEYNSKLLFVGGDSDDN